ncbi:hypothetical protein THOM_2407, partial [Trachipleistophora hominis]
VNLRIKGFLVDLAIFLRSASDVMVGNSCISWDVSLDICWGVGMEWLFYERWVENDSVEREGIDDPVLLQEMDYRPI